MKYIALKQELKQLAFEIRSEKLESKEHQRKHGWSRFFFRIKAQEFRHKHIAYCLLRGRKYEEVEVFTNNPPDFELVGKIMDEHKEETVENVCACP